MILGKYEQEEIKSYFMLDKKIQDIRMSINSKRKMFYDQTMSTRTTHGDTRLISVGFDPERNVIPYLDVMSSLETRLEFLIKKKVYFEQYLSSISLRDRSYLINRYKNNIPSKVCQIDIDAHEEIEEINEAINHMQGHPVEITQEEIDENSKNITDRVSFMAEMLGV